MKRMSKKKRNNWIIAGAVILAVVAGGVALYFGVPEVKEFINGIFSQSEEVVEEVEATAKAFLA